MMRDLINLVESLTEGRAYQIDTGYGKVTRPTTVFMNPSVEQAETLAKKATLNGLLYIRGLLFDGKYLYVGVGGSLTHDDLVQNFLGGVKESDSRVTTFELTNYRMQGPKPTITEPTIYTGKPGDHNVETNPLAQKLLQGCKLVFPDTVTEEDDEEDNSNFPSVRILEPLLPELAEVAQKVYDLWDQDEDGYDEDVGSGGICHLIADQLVHVISAAGVPHIYTVSDNFEVHVYAVAAFEEGVFQIDIPHRIYERGGGYTWTKLPDVHFQPSDIHVNMIDGNPRNIGQYVEDAEEFYEEKIDEAPIGDWTVDHAFDDNEREMVGQFKGYSREQKHWSDPDKKVIRDPGSIEHVRNGFKNTSATFNLYFYQANDPDYDIFMQKGVVDLDWVKQRMGEKSAAAVAQSVRPGQITVIMTNNLSDESWISIRSPWMVAHRMAHTLITGESRLEASWKVMEIFDKFVRDISSYGYGVKWPRGDDYHSTLFRKDYYEAYRKVLGHALGTMRSARAKKLTQDTEWYMETFAQYLMTGRVKLYTLPKEIHPDEQLTSDPVKLAKVQKAWEEFPVRITKAFDRLLKDAEGKIWVM